MSERKIGDLVDSLGVTAELDETDLVSEALVLLRVSTEREGEGVVICPSEGMGHVTQLGVVTRAADLVRYDDGD